MTLDFESEKAPTGEKEEVKILKTSLDVQFPVVRQSAFSLMIDIFGHEKGTFIVSPEGGMPKDEYLRLASEFRPGEKSTGWSRGDGKEVGTREDTVRFWMLRNSEFQENLIENGWTSFSKMDEWNDRQKKDHFIDYDKWLSRETSVEDISNVIKSGMRAEDCKLLLDELEIIRPFMGDKVYAGFHPSSLGSDLMVVGETSFPGIHLQLSRFWHEYSRDPTPAISLDAALYLGESEYAKLPGEWNEIVSGRVQRLVSGKIGKDQRGYCRSRDEKSFTVHYDDHGEEIQSSAELEGRLRRVQELVEYGQKAAALEREEIEKVREATYKDRQTRLGAPPEQTE